MNPSRLLPSVLCFLPRLAVALCVGGSSVLCLGAAPATSTISAVTVYTDRAVVTRTASVDLPAGTTELIFANLPQALDERSLQVSGRGTAQALILDVSAKQTFVDFTPNARVKELEDQLKGLGKQVRGLDDRGHLLNASQATLDRMETALFAPPAKDVPRPDLNQFTSSLNYLTEQKARLVTERAALDEQREELQNKISTVQQQLNELRGSGGRAFKTVTVRVSAPQTGSLEVALSYTVPGASWSPSYDARVLSTERAVALGYFGIVRQSTGEDWKDVALTLSTARPGLGGAAPVLTVWNVDVFNPILYRQANMRDERRQDKLITLRENAPATAGAVNMQTMTSDVAMPEEEKDAEMASATIEAGATSASFKIASSASVPSDNSPQKVPITAAKFAANPEYLTVPKRLATAYLTAKVYNNSEFPLLAGAMNVFLDGTFVATSAVRTVMSGEKFDLALGRRRRDQREAQACEQVRRRHRPDELRQAHHLRISHHHPEQQADRRARDRGRPGAALPQREDRREAARARREGRETHRRRHAQVDARPQGRRETRDHGEVRHRTRQRRERDRIGVTAAL